MTQPKRRPKQKRKLRPLVFRQDKKGNLLCQLCGERLVPKAQRTDPNLCAGVQIHFNLFHDLDVVVKEKSEPVQ